MGLCCAEIGVRACFDILCTSEEPCALVDVRTRAEWLFVGVPDATVLAHPVLFCEWSSFGSSTPRASFTKELDEALKDKGIAYDNQVFFLCRSGARSLSAGVAMRERGWLQCFNVTGGFEGELGKNKQRGCVKGWKFEGLPWVQS